MSCTDHGCGRRGVYVRMYVYVAGGQRTSSQSSGAQCFGRDVGGDDKRRDPCGFGAVC